jgi:hypothetical protein
MFTNNALTRPKYKSQKVFKKSVLVLPTVQLTRPGDYNVHVTERLHARWIFIAAKKEYIGTNLSLSLCQHCVAHASKVESFISYACGQVASWPFQP